MTEEEAKTKWCPFARVASLRGVINRTVVQQRRRGSPLKNATRCIASQCMAWRWRPETHIHHVTGDYPNFTTHEEHIPPRTQGYCGLAGESR